MTMAWWRGDARRESADGYRRHLAMILPSLPPTLGDFRDRVTLHDARLRRLTIDLPRGSLDLMFDGYLWNPHALGEPRAWHLRYTGVTSLTSTADPAGGLPGPAGYGDLGYDELDVIEPRLFEHRMLFSTSIELHVRFRDLVVV